MAAIRTTFGEGGANLTPDDSAGSPSLATALRDAADDLAALKPTATVSPPSAPAVAAPTKGEFDLVQAEVAELRAIVDALAAATIKTTKA